jgi:hypothetical protein
VNCIPWDYPIPRGINSKTLSVCMSYEGDGFNNSLLAFDKAMGDVNNTKNCDEVCLPNCDETTYKYTVDTTELDTEELCSDRDTREVRHDS